jgi:SAM-dependent methyltransferase
MKWGKRLAKFFFLPAEPSKLLVSGAPMARDEFSVPQEFYTSGRYAELNPTWNIEHAPWKTHKIIELLPSEIYLHLPGGIRLIDVGCGIGEVLRLISDYLETKGFEVEPLGYDIAKEAIAQASSRFKKARFFQKPFAANELNKTDTLTLVLLIDILEHVQDPDSLLQEVAKVADYVVAHLPIEDNLNFNLRGLKRGAMEQSGHIHFFNLKSARLLLEANGFRILKEKLTCFDYDGEPRPTPQRRIGKIGQQIRRRLFPIAPGSVSYLIGGCSVFFLLENKVRVK